MHRTFILFAFATSLAVCECAHAECAADASDDSLTKCLAQDLRDSDQHINSVYQQLMGHLNDKEKISLRDEQRGWLKSRDGACALNNKESDREKWLEAILANQEKTICVVRYTFTRVAQLDDMLRLKAPTQFGQFPSAPSVPRLAPRPGTSSADVTLPAFLSYMDDGYKARSESSHGRGRWYVEITLDRGAIAQIGDMLLAPGFFCPKSSFVHLVSIRHGQAGMPPVVVGLAIDLDNDFFYSNLDGQWKVAPGQTGSIAIEPGEAYSLGLDGSSEVKELIKRGLVRINIGQQAFQYELPPGYRAWGSL